MSDTPIADDFAAIAANVAAAGAPAAAEAHQSSDWAVGDLEPVVSDLRSTVGILGHLITANSSCDNEVDDNAWRKVESDLLRLTDRVEKLWQAAWDQHVATAAEHKAALEDAVATANAKAAPGSPADIESAATMWRLLRVIANAAIERCDEAQGITAAGRSEEKQP